MREEDASVPALWASLISLHSFALPFPSPNLVLSGDPLDPPANLQYLFKLFEFALSVYKMGNVCSSAAATTNVVAPPTKRTTNPQIDNKSAAEKSFSVPTTSSAMTSSLLSAQSRPFAAVYETRDELGKGQYATVFKCVSKPNALPNGEKFVGAVKVIDKSKLTPEDLVALNIEVKAMDTLKDHPNFVKCQ